MIEGWKSENFSKHVFVLLFLLAISLLFSAHVFAQSESTDCTDTANDGQDEFVTAIQNELQKLTPSYTLTIFTDKDLKKALLYHQQYCCQNRINEKTCEWKLEGKFYFPESPYLFDHLLYIGMRKFNWIQEHCDTLWIDCFTRDNKVLLKEWREESQKLAEETDGVPPSQLYELFKKYWWDVETFTKKENKNQIANAYYTMCYEALQIWRALKFNLVDSVNQPNEWENRCRAMVQKRYMEELWYVQSLMVDKWVQYLYENMRTYLQTYFVDNRMSAFVDKFWKLDACLNMVLKYVTRTSCCVN